MFRCLSLASLLLLAPVGRAAAQGADAEALIDQGVEQRRARNDERALELFRQAHELAPSGRTLAQMGFAEQALGMWVEAYLHLTEARARSDAWVEEHRDIIDGALEAVSGRVGRLQIRGGVEGAEVWLNGTRRGTLPLEDPLVVVAGTVQLRVRAPGHREISRTITAPAGQLSRETVRMVAAEPEDAEASGGEAGGPELGPTADSSSAGADEAPSPRGGSGGDGLMIGGVVTLALGAVALGLGGAAFGVREANATAFNDDSRCYTQPDATRGEQCAAELSAVETAEILGGLGIGLGAALAIVGAVLLGASAASGDQDQAAVRCGGGPGELGLACGGVF